MTRRAPAHARPPHDVDGRPSAGALMVLASQVGPALRAFFRQAAAWQLTPAEQRALLGQPSKTTFYRWQRGETKPGGVTLDLIERLSHLFGIYGALHSVYVDPARADAWIRRTNTAPLFGGTTPLQRMLGGRMVDLIDTRRYVEAAAEPSF